MKPEDVVDMYGEIIEVGDRIVHGTNKRLWVGVVEEVLFYPSQFHGVTVKYRLVFPTMDGMRRMTLEYDKPSVFNLTKEYDD